MTTTKSQTHNIKWAVEPFSFLELSERNVNELLVVIIVIFVDKKFNFNTILQRGVQR